LLGEQQQAGELVGQIERNARVLVNAVLGSSKLDVVEPQGGMFCFVNIKGTGKSSDEFATGLLNEKSVAVTPGKIFGENWDNYVRISLGVEDSQFKEGIELIQQFVGELKE